MGYSFTISKDDAYHPKEDGLYSWPCKDEPDRKLELFVDDVLTKDQDGTYTCHTGICCVRIKILDSEVELWNEDKKLRIS